MILRFLLHIFIQFTPNLTAEKRLHWYIFFVVHTHFCFWKWCFLTIARFYDAAIIFTAREIITSTAQNEEEENIAAVTTWAYKLLAYLVGESAYWIGNNFHNIHFKRKQNECSKMECHIIEIYRDFRVLFSNHQTFINTIYFRQCDKYYVRKLIQIFRLNLRGIKIYKKNCHNIIKYDKHNALCAFDT